MFLLRFHDPLCMYDFNVLKNKKRVEIRVVSVLLNLLVEFRCLIILSRDLSKKEFQLFHIKERKKIKQKLRTVFLENNDVVIRGPFIKLQKLNNLRLFTHCSFWSFNWHSRKFNLPTEPQKNRKSNRIDRDSEDPRKRILEYLLDFQV